MNLGVDLTPLWLTLKVAGVATLVSFWSRGDSGLPGGPEPVLGPGGPGRPLHPAPGAAAHGPGVLPHRPHRAQGWLGHWLQETWGISLIFTWQGAALAAAVVSLPLIYKSARAAFEGVDPNLENAARTLGAVGGRGLSPGLPAPGLAGHSGRGHDGLRPGHGRVRRHPDGGRQPARQDPDPVPRRL